LTGLSLISPPDKKGISDQRQLLHAPSDFRCFEIPINRSRTNSTCDSDPHPLAVPEKSRKRPHQTPTISLGRLITESLVMADREHEPVAMTPSPAPDLTRNRLPTLFEVLSRRTLPPVDLFSFYIYMRDQQRSVDYLDFWLVLLTALCVRTTTDNSQGSMLPNTCPCVAIMSVSFVDRS
jgi:hypothetical protein